MELPSSMKKLCRLSLLELKKCSKLEVVLANFNLASLRELDLSDCYLLKSYPESSPNIQELDPWIGRISRLRRLELSGMRKLVSLPPLPDSLLVLNAENCESLERLDCSFRNPEISLNFINCFKLNQEARDLIIQMPTSAVFPAEEVPMCFSYRSSGSALTVKLNQMPIGKSTKFKAGILCAGEDEKDFIWGIWHLCTFEVEVETEEVTSTELVFDFELGFSQYEPMVDDSVYKQMVRHVKQKISNKWEIRECGILQLLEVPLRNIIESFGDGSEDYEP
uniref:C-JID domain-containing protein n=1 Tax=Brassica oleracea var. oleracea TaxID=109376 RepID=A0A0D3BJW1_BRAOL